MLLLENMNTFRVFGHSVLICAVFLLKTASLSAYEKPDKVEEHVWSRVESYLFPEDHPIKKKLDELFSSSQVIDSAQAVQDAGFTKAKERKWTHIIVTKHPKIPDYIFKIYLNSHVFSSEKDRREHDYFLMRIHGAQQIFAKIQKCGWEKKFKVPKKWLYLLPSAYDPQGSSERKFILIEENMNILPRTKNEKKWGSKKVTRKLLTEFYEICEELGLKDSTKPDNAPFCEDGKVAFIDTQLTNQWPVKYDRLTRFLAEELQPFWINLTMPQETH